ncbi:hypothetical protein [Nocardia cerradoensis]|uniref:hypothetical protein n=1 Tax=Nocardia cerradoensis TaxID=85688 RepID=UPI00031D2E10|nr:hypothetical protein [Nocardia cerradoensis]NKY46569.1 hypothetical protein [Nocardia cerradoensis]
MSEPGVVPDREGSGASAPEPSVFRRIGVDWWAVIVAGAFVLLAVANALPKIPW